MIRAIDPEPDYTFTRDPLVVDITLGTHPLTCPFLSSRLSARRLA